MFQPEIFTFVHEKVPAKKKCLAARLPHILHPCGRDLRASLPKCPHNRLQNASQSLEPCHTGTYFSMSCATIGGVKMCQFRVIFCWQCSCSPVDSLVPTTRKTSGVSWRPSTNYRHTAGFYKFTKGQVQSMNLYFSGTTLRASTALITVNSLKAPVPLVTECPSCQHVQIEQSRPSALAHKI